MALARPTEAGLQQVVRGERREARRQRPRAADQDPRDRRSQIVVGHARGYTAQVREGAHMAVEKADLILPLVDPGEVAAGVHQPQQEEPRLATLAGDVDEHLEEVDLGEIAGTVRQRHEDLAPLSLPLGNRISHQRDAHLMALGVQQLMQPRRRQPLLAARPAPRLVEQRLDPRADGVPHGPAPRPGLLARRGRLVQILPHRHSRDPQLPRHGPLRPSFDQHLVPDHMHLIHSDHPLQRMPAPHAPASPSVRPSGGLLSER
jgi:hypothetical protein